VIGVVLVSPLLSEITPALRSFLDSSGVRTPFVVVDIDVVVVVVVDATGSRWPHLPCHRRRCSG